MMSKATLSHLLFLVLSLFPILVKATPYEVTEISHLDINSAITPATYEYLRYQFKQLPEGSLALVKLNTPGGLISTTKDIITFLGQQERPFVVWVTPEGASAASAGAIIASAAHFILMSPGTVMGAATPVGLGKDLSEKDGRSKAMNDLKALVRSLSHSRHRSAAPFEEMIETAKSFTDQEALKAGIIDGVVTNGHSLKDLLSGKSFTLQGAERELTFSPEVLSKSYDATLGQKFLSVVADPSTAYILFLVGVALIYFEFQAPGGFVAGGVGGGLLLLSAVSFQVLPLDWGAFGLILIGVTLLILELYVTSYGLLAIGGVTCFAAGSLFLFHGDEGFISVNYALLLSSFFGVATGIAVIVWALVKDQKKVASAGFFSPLGAQGVVLARDGSLYQIKVRGEIWRARSDSQLEVDERVEVVTVDSEKLETTVRKLPKE